jgi:hypothetical protein
MRSRAKECSPYETYYILATDKESIVALNRHITKIEIDGAAGGLTIGPSGSSNIAPPKPKCAAPDSSATTRQGIKNTISPAGNVGEGARRRPVVRQ